MGSTVSDNVGSPQWPKGAIGCFLCAVGSCSTPRHDTVRVRVLKKAQVNVLDIGVSWRGAPDCIALRADFKCDPITHVMIHPLVQDSLEPLPTLVLLASLAVLQDKQPSASDPIEYNNRESRIKLFQKELDKRDRDNENNPRSVNKVTQKTDWEVSNALENAIARIRQLRHTEHSHSHPTGPSRATGRVYGYTSPDHQAAPVSPPSSFRYPVEMSPSENSVWPKPSFMKDQHYKGATVTFRQPIPLEKALEWARSAHQDDISDNIKIILQMNESIEKSTSLDPASLPAIAERMQALTSSMTTLIENMEDKLSDLAQGAFKMSNKGKEKESSGLKTHRVFQPKLFSHEDLPSVNPALVPDTSAERVATLERDLAELREQMNRCTVSPALSNWDDTSNHDNSNFFDDFSAFG